MKDEIENSAINTICRQFLPDLRDEIHSIPEIKELLIRRINFLLDHDFEKLMQILYRIDVDEQKATEAIASKSDEKPATRLADLIILRLMEKATTRFQHKSKKGDW